MTHCQANPVAKENVNLPELSPSLTRYELSGVGGEAGGEGLAPGDVGVLIQHGDGDLPVPRRPLEDMVVHPTGEVEEGAHVAAVLIRVGDELQAEAIALRAVEPRTLHILPGGHCGNEPTEVG